MNLLYRLGVGASMALFGTVSLLAMAGLAAIALVNLRAGDQLATALLDTVRLVRAAGNADMMHDALRGDVQAARLATGPEALKAARDDLARHASALDKALDEVDSAATAAMRQALSGVRPDVQVYLTAARRLADHPDQADEAGRQAFDGDFERLEKSLGALSGLIEAEAEAQVAQRESTHQRARLLLAGAVLAGSVLIVGFVTVFARTTLRRLGAEPLALQGLAEHIASGQLDGRFARTAPDSSVAGAMLRMQHTLAATVQRIRSNADSVASASSQIAQGNGDLSVRTENQASALQQTAAAMEQLGATVRLNADNAHRADQLAQGASAAAVKGGQVVGQTVETMRGIDEASRRIADIIGVIDGIAFQTNILALNAAVEAARAGEQGRGFAVVASEVRGLAGRSAEAAKEIKGLISQSVERVQRGTALVDEAGRTMTEVVQAIRSVTDIVAEISTASAGQSQGVLQAGATVTAMDRATQQNAALVEQTAAAASALEDQAQRMVQSVASFKLPSAA